MKSKQQNWFPSLVISFVLSVSSYTVFDCHTIWKWGGLATLCIAIYFFVKVWREICQKEEGVFRKEFLIELVVYALSLHVVTAGIYFLFNQWIALAAGVIVTGLFSARLLSIHA